jgi:hypothetical protein
VARSEQECHLRLRLDGMASHKSIEKKLRLQYRILRKFNTLSKGVEKKKAIFFPYRYSQKPFIVLLSF